MLGAVGEFPFAGEIGDGFLPALDCMHLVGIARIPKGLLNHQGIIRLIINQKNRYPLLHSCLCFS